MNYEKPQNERKDYCSKTREDILNNSLVHENYRIDDLINLLNFAKRKPEAIGFALASLGFSGKEFIEFSICLLLYMYIWAVFSLCHNIQKITWYTCLIVLLWIHIRNIFLEVVFLGKSINANVLLQHIVKSLDIVLLLFCFYTRNAWTYPCDHKFSNRRCCQIIVFFHLIDN